MHVLCFSVYKILLWMSAEKSDLTVKICWLSDFFFPSAFFHSTVHFISFFSSPSHPSPLLHSCSLIFTIFLPSFICLCPSPVLFFSSMYQRQAFYVTVVILKDCSCLHGWSWSWDVVKKVRGMWTSLLPDTECLSCMRKNFSVWRGFLTNSDLIFCGHLVCKLH